MKFVDRQHVKHALPIYFMDHPIYTGPLSINDRGQRVIPNCKKTIKYKHIKPIFKGVYKNLIKKNPVSKFICYGAIAILKYIYFLWC